MIEKTLHTDDGKIRVRIPTMLNEITLGQLIAIQEKQHLDDLDAISILSGVPKEELANVINFDDFSVFGDHVQSLSKQIIHLYESDTIPQKIAFTIGQQHVVVDVIHNLSVEPAGAFLAARDIIADEISRYIQEHSEENWQSYFQPSLKACCHILAHYFFCRVTQKRYDEYEAEAFCEQVKKLRVTEALPIARHFFTCYPNLSKQRTGFWQQLRQYWKRKQASGRSKNLNT